MATKPNIVLARFADTLAANVVNPPSGSRDTGYVASDPLDEGVANALALQYYRWFQFLDAIFNGIGNPNATHWLLGSDGKVDSGATITLSGTTWHSTTSGGEQFVTFRVPLPSGTRITSITVNGLAGNAPGEVFRAFFNEISSAGSVAQVSTTKTSGTSGVAESIGWTTADTGFSPNGYVMTDLPHDIVVGIAQTSVAAEVRVFTIKIEVG